MAHIDVGCNIIAAIQQFNPLSKCNQRFDLRRGCLAVHSIQGRQIEKLQINPAKGLQLDLVSFKLNFVDRLL